MDRVFVGGFGTLVLFILVGCGGSSQDPTHAADNGSGRVSVPQDGSAAPSAADPETAAIAEAARGFLEAVIQGDTQLATTYLTPQAAMRLQEGGAAFQPPGLDTWSCQIGEVRRLNEAQAFVQCYWSDPSVTGETADEMCCLVKYVDTKWRVSGIAFQVNPNEQPRILDFEQPVQATPAPEKTVSHSQGTTDSNYYRDPDGQTAGRQARQPGDASIQK